MVCACSLRTQQGACKASAKVCVYLGFGWGGLFYHPSDDSFGWTLFGVLPGFEFFLESLILAQDERWRRA